MKQVSILIANYKGREALELCIESVLKRTKYNGYKIIVLDLSPESCSDKQYLRTQRDKGNIELLENDTILSHGQALTRLIKHCKMEYACLLDSDCEILAGDWLAVLVKLLKGKNDLAVAKFKKGGSIPHLYWVAPIYWPCVMLLNRQLYREFEGTDDWSQRNISFSEYRYQDIFKDVKEKPKQDIVSRDTGWRFTEKVLFETGNKYKIYPMPKDYWDVKVKHYGGISRNHFRPEHPIIKPRWEAIKKNLNKLRNEA